MFTNKVILKIIFLLIFSWSDSSSYWATILYITVPPLLFPPSWLTMHWFSVISVLQNICFLAMFVRLLLVSSSVIICSCTRCIHFRDEWHTIGKTKSGTETLGTDITSSQSSFCDIKGGLVLLLWISVKAKILLDCFFYIFLVTLSSDCLDINTHCGFLHGTRTDRWHKRDIWLLLVQ